MPNLPHHFDLCREEDEHHLHIDIIVDHCQVQRVTFQKNHLIAYRDMIQGRAAREIAAQEAAGDEKQTTRLAVGLLMFLRDNHLLREE
jgi:hypothetical protein